MQRVSGGLAVPKDVLDIFTGKTTTMGNVTCVLKYTPKSLNDIVVDWVYVVATGKWRIAQAVALAGKTVEVATEKFGYYKTDTPSGGANSGGAGADPHGHALTYTQEEVINGSPGNEALGPIRIHYTVA